MAMARFPTVRWPNSSRGRSLNLCSIRVILDATNTQVSMVDIRVRREPFRVFIHSRENDVCTHSCTNSELRVTVLALVF